MKKLILCIALAMPIAVIAQTEERYEYAHVLVMPKAFSKKLYVKVDLGNTLEQAQTGKEYSRALNKTKSVASVLNYMTDRKFELVESKDQTLFIYGSGGTSGTTYTFKRKK